METATRMRHDKKIIGVCGETSIANAKQSIVTMSQVRYHLSTRVHSPNTSHRSTNISSHITSPKRLKVSSVPSLVCPVVSPCTDSVRQTRTSRYLSPMVSSKTTLRIGSTRCISRTSSTWVRIDTWLPWFSSISKITRPSLCDMRMPRLWLLIQSGFYWVKGVDGSIPLFIILLNLSFWINYVDSVVSRWGLWSLLTCCQQSLHLSLLPMWVSCFIRSMWINWQEWRSCTWFI